MIPVTQDALVTGVNNVQASDKIIAWPNPTSGKLTVSLDNSLQDEYLIQVLNDLGDVILAMKQPKDAKTAEIDLSGCAAGLYTIRVSSANENYRIKVSRR